MPYSGSTLRETYVLRIWEELPSSSGKRTLRIVLQEASTGHRAGFASLDALIEYLRAHVDADGSGHKVLPFDPIDGIRD